ncbi:LysE family translocator [Quatrionicoccus australiensis]|uniref:LysE family translocator n=1 Tax=Quatrionicoccus australiensis TaxID=138118 RepID=UPI001CFA33FE|nr:LysE family translocator [Quatrionicoccus australiensis]MCB4361564.1 LysE family translocator [Quatrionicoccus australiensis]
MDALLSLTQTAGLLLAALLVTLAPGPDNLLVLSLGMARGRRQGIAFGLGCAAGCLNHTLLAALGISALIAASPSAFAALKAAGGLYLVWLGVQAIRNARPSGATAPAGAPESNVQLFRKGLIANAINPKVVLFFLAFLPQFVDHARADAGLQIVQLGLLFTLQAALVFAGIGWFAGRIGERLARSPRLALWLDRVAGGVFVLLGARLLSDG